ncbi:hypothetical protein AB1E18_010068 [Capra hircus]
MRAARSSNGSEKPIRMSGANHSGVGEGGEATRSFPLPPAPRDFRFPSVPPDLRSVWDLGTVRFSGLSRVRSTAPKSPPRVLTWGLGLPSRVGLLRQKPSGNVTAMPVDTLTPGARDTPALPIRLRTKVPGYLLRRPADGGARKPSAVERLEADKAKYVKSLHVANTRQEPVQPLLCKQPLFSPGTRRTVLTPSRRALPGPGRRPQLDLDILSSLINLCDSPVSPAEASRTPGWAEGARQPPPATPPRPPPSIAAVRRVDVLPLPASPVQPCPSPGPAAASSPVRPPGLQRSKSDLSERFSRAAADLERFFNFCGLDPEEAQGLGVAHLARASSDIVSLAGPSAGPASSEGDCSRRSSVTIEDRARERVPYGVSVIERNARVIKWLYGLRQARESPAAEG